MRKIGSWLCLLIAAAAVIFAVIATGSKSSLFFGLALFRTVQTGSFMGMIGNIFCVLLTVAGYGATGFYGVIKPDSKMALLWSAGMTALGIISLVIAAFNHFTLGDLIIVVPSAMVLISLFTGED